MARKFNLQEARKKIKRVFKYLGELNRIKTPPDIEVRKYKWLFWLDRLPRFSTIVRGQDFGNLHLLSAAEGSLQEPAPEVTSGNYIFKVGRPKESECPEPSIKLKNWLRPGYTDVGADPEEFLKESIKTTTGKAEEFDHVPSRVEAFEDWLSTKRQWEISEKKTLEAMAAFEHLFDLRGKIQRESEKYQIYAADGILVTTVGANTISHPVLLQRIILDFNAAGPEFIIRDNDDPPEINSALLRFSGVESSALKRVRLELQEGHFHPFGGEDTSHYLRDLVQRLWSDGQYFENEVEAAEASGGSYLYRKPLLFLGNRSYGYTESIESYIELIPEFEDFPESLLRVVGIDTGGSERTDEELKEVDLLLTKLANMEQERVLHRLEDTSAVLVQGPPGTGKSHTIANLIGHLLAENKSILVTSHTSKALRVVRDHVSESLQSLCVSVLEDDETNNKQLEESISGIINYLSTTSKKKLEKQIEELREKRTNLKQELDETREALLLAAEDEYKTSQVGSREMLPSEAARWLLENAETNAWIPGPLTGNECPIDQAGLEDLYELNREISAEDEAFLLSELPEEERLPTPEVFAAHFDGLGNLKEVDNKVGEEFWTHDDQDPERLKKLVDRVQLAAEVFGAKEPWVDEFLEIGRQKKAIQKPWIEILDQIDELATEIPKKEGIVLSHGPKIENERSDADNLKVCQAILAHLEGGKKLKALSTMLHRDWKDFVECSQVDSGRPSKTAHFEALQSMIEIKMSRDNLLQRWNRQVEHLDNDPLEDPGKKPEKKLEPLAKKMRAAMSWYGEKWGPVKSELEEEYGLDWDRLLRTAPTMHSEDDEHGALRSTIAHLLIPILESRCEFAAWRTLESRQDEWVEYLDSFSRQADSYPIIKMFRSGVRKADYDTYRQTWDQLQRLNDLRDGHLRRIDLLETLRPVAPEWVEEIEARKKPHASGELPGDPEAAWTHRVWEQVLEDRAQTDLDQLQSKLNELTEDVQDQTGQYVEKLSWLAQLERTGLEQQQALNGWLGLHKKIGKGTGKHVRILKEEAKKTLAKCREAVPVWIMPLSRVVESFDIATTRFDVLIIDEASQCDVLGLVAFALAKEIVVVGDHEQVSPYAVGFKTDQIHELIDEILIDIPNKTLYDAKTSVYALARQSFGGTIRLVEHFRCVPDIIQFSNQMCYGGEIKPLREASASPFTPHLIAHRVEGAVENNKINKKEALELVSLVLAVTRLDEYQDSTIGVISMVGTQQAVYIDSILRRRLTVSEYQRRRVLCGNASQFQGDERDVIFISMVNSPTESGRPLHLRTRDDARKVFNVAASRARDQMWIVHSLDPQKDLKPNDLRLKMITHAENPAGLRPKNIEVAERKLNSELEKQVHQELVEAKYETIIGCPVGEFTIDLVVVGKRGNRVAIQCDGDRDITPEDLEAGLNKQMTLERLGWRFIRVRGSEYLRHPHETMRKIQKRLKKFEIEPMGLFDGRSNGKNNGEGGNDEEDLQSSDLHKQVLQRAESIRTRWKDIPSVSSIFKQG